MSRFATPVLTISGGRQVGKTETLLRRAVQDAERGFRVLYVAENHACVRNSLYRAEMMLDFPEDVRIRRTSGRESIEWVRGGSIVFKTPFRSVRGMSFDTLLLDEVTISGSFAEDCEQTLVTSKMPWIVRAVAGVQL